MRLSTFDETARDLDALWQRFFGAEPSGRGTFGAYEVPTDVFHTEDKLVIRMDLPDVSPEDVDVTTQDNVLLINGTRRFAYDGQDVRFVRRGAFYGDFTQRVALGKGLDMTNIGAHYENGVLELTIPYSPEVQPKRIAIQSGERTALSS